MDSMGGMDMGGDSSNAPLNATGVDFNNSTQAADFLSALLDDDQLKVTGNAYARYFNYGLAVIVGIAALFRIARWLTLKARLRAATQGKQKPAMPRSLPTQWLATITALGREATYLQLTPKWKVTWLRVPTMGNVLLIATHLAFILALEFVNNDTPGAQYWQALGVRAAWLAVAQMPLLILLIGKNNIIGLLTGVSYERLNVFHRWTARFLLLMAIFHFAFQMTGWNEFGLVQLEWSTDTCPPSGIAAFAVLLWINLSTIAPLRFLSYEFFVVQHIVSFIGFIIAVMYHLPSTALWSRIYVYIPIALYLVDRIVRTVWVFVVNARISRAVITPLEGGVTKVQIKTKAVKSWRPGSHVLLHIPRFGLLQNHPATIVSTPQSHGGDLVFMLKSHKGFTRRIMTSANGSATALLPQTKEDTGPPSQLSEVASHWAILDGPYGGWQSDFAAFDSACLIAGSTGVTFTLGIMLDLADRASVKKLPLRRLHFVWCIKDSLWAAWAKTEIAAACEKLAAAGVDTKVSIFVTCSDIYTEQSSEKKECGCTCDKSLGPCCCVVVDEGADEAASKADDEAIAPVNSVVKPVSSKRETTIAERQATSSASSAVEAGVQAPVKLSVLPCADFYSGRPAIADIINTTLEDAEGESGVAVCGPIGLNSSVRNTVVRLSDQRAIHKGSGAQGCYLHVESFS